MSFPGHSIELDYIFFLYGLALIVLAEICRTLSRSDTSTLPWAWLRWFALSHGLNQWLKMIVLGWGDHAVLEVVRPWVMLVSFACLLEFGREGQHCLRGSGPGRWVHLPLLACVGLGLWAGPAAMPATVRYTYGLASGLWAAWTLWLAGRSNQQGYRALRTLAWLMAGYALAIGLVVPPTDFFPAARFNQVFFEQSAGFPIQAVRGLLAILIAASVWDYRRLSESARLANPMSYKWHGVQLAGTLASVAAVGWLVTEAVGRQAQSGFLHELEFRARTVVAGLDPVAVQHLSATPGRPQESSARLVKRQMAQLNAIHPDLERIWLVPVRGQGGSLALDAAAFNRLGIAPRWAPRFERALRLAAAGRGKAGAWHSPGWRQLWGYAPVYDPGERRVLALVCAHGDPQAFAQAIALHRAEPIEVTLTLSLILVGLFAVRRTSEALRESEENLAVTLHSIHDAVLAVDTHGRVGRLNPAAEQMTGWPQAQAQGRQIAEVLPLVQGPDRQPVALPIQAVLTTGRTVELDANTRLVSQRGSERFVAASVAPIRDSRGVLIGVVLVCRDVTEEQRHREALRRSEAEARKLALVAARTDNGVVLTDPQGHIEWVNQGFTRITGYTLEEAVGKKPGTLLQGLGSDPAVRDQMSRAIRAKTGFNVELVNYAKNGRKYWVGIEMQPLLDEEGRVAHFMGLQRDITERKHAEEEIRRFNNELEQRVRRRTEQLRESEQRLAQIIDFLPDATLAIDTRGVVLAWNRAIEKLTGVPAGEVVGKGEGAHALALYGSRRPLLLDLILKPIQSHESLYRALQREGDMITGEAECVVQGKRLVLWGIASPLYNGEGQVVGAIESIRDFTEYKELEQQLRQAQKMEAVGQLAGGVAHDFNNLLAVILGNSEMALAFARSGSSQAGECLKQVVAATTRAANLTRQLLAFSRKQAIQVQPVNLGEVVVNFSKMLRRLIGETIQLQCHCPAGLPLILADTGMLEQVLVNLVVNARDAMPNGGPLQISTRAVHFQAEDCHAHSQARPGDFVCLSVADAGTGIPPEHLNRIFEPFFTTKPEDKGTGLGLATVYGIVKQHQGWIEVASCVGVGTTFHVFLPAQPVASPATPAASPADKAMPGGHESILLVEDEESVRNMLRQLLQSRGYQVLEAISGRQALETWELCRGKVDLLLTDIVMPGGIDGYELARALRQFQPQLKVLFMSGYNSQGATLAVAPDLQPHSRFLQKPYSSGALLQNVRLCLDAS